MSQVTKPADPAAMPYRPCVGIMLINRSGLVWIGRRRKTIAEDGEHWQMPQGGIDPFEEPAAAAIRELAEETGTAKADILAESRHWHYYDLPPHLLGVALQGRFRGQTQKWLALRFTGEDADFNIHAPPGGHEPEFDTWRWSPVEELLPIIVPFKRPVYEAVIAEFRSYLR
ncbi:MAG: RNA pyrophosphohydrolase [Rhodomicrobium sp.]|nr:RNA pyrophosphohydrolase [Rhodomicrobium sp.]